MPELLGRMLLKIDKLDVGDCKKTRIRTFVRAAFRAEKSNSIDLKKLAALSQLNIQREIYKL